MSSMDTLRLAEVPRAVGRSSGSNIPRILTLLGIFLVLLYLYVNLTQPPLGIEGAQADGISSVFSIYGWGSERLSSPNSVASGPDGDIYVADSGNHRVAVFDQDGNFKFAIGGKADKPKDQPKKGPLLFPLGLTVSGSGDVYVASMARSKVFIFNRKGALKREIEVDRPIEVAIYGDEVFVSTPGQIKVFTPAGEPKREWGARGRNIGSFEYPNGMDFDSRGNLFVSDTQNSRIQIFDIQGKFRGTTGTPPAGLNDAGRMFGLNMGLAVDDAERVYVADAFKHSIHVFDHDGNKIGEFGQQGESEGRFNYPSGLAYLGSGRFAVADKWNDRVQIVRIALPTAGTVSDRFNTLYPYIILVLLLLLLAYLSRRRHTLESPAVPAARRGLR